MRGTEKGGEGIRCWSIEERKKETRRDKGKNEKGMRQQERRVCS